MEALSAHQASIVSWAARAVGHLDELSVLTRSLSRAELLICQLRDQLTEAKAAAGETAARDARYESLVEGLVAVVSDVGLAWNSEASAFENVVNAFAWLKLAHEQSNETNTRLVAEVARFALEMKEANEINTKLVAEIAEDERFRREIYDAVWKVIELPYEPGNTFSWNIVNTIEILHRQSKASPAAQDLARLLDALGAPSVEVALRAVESARVPGVTYEATGILKTCKRCKITFVTPSNAKNRQYCDECRPDLSGKREPVRSDAPAVPRPQGVPCSACIHGEPCAASDTGFQCLAGRARECRPLDEAKCFQQA